MVIDITHFVLISLVLVVVTAHHIDVVVAFVSNSAKPLDIPGGGGGGGGSVGISKQETR